MPPPESKPMIKPRRSPIWRHPRRLFRYFELRLMRLEGAPRQVARGLAIGVFIGLLPIVPLHTVGALGTAVLTRSSKVAALMGTLVSNPFDLVPHYLLIYYIGKKILPIDVPAFDPAHLRLSNLIAEGGDLFAVLMTGGLALAVPTALAVYFLAFMALKKYQARRAVTSPPRSPSKQVQESSSAAK